VHTGFGGRLHGKGPYHPKGYGTSPCSPPYARSRVWTALLTDAPIRRMTVHLDGEGLRLASWAERDEAAEHPDSAHAALGCRTGGLAGAVVLGQVRAVGRWRRLIRRITGWITSGGTLVPLSDLPDAALAAVVFLIAVELVDVEGDKGYSLNRSGIGSCSWSSPVLHGRFAAGRSRLGG
jgi:hypothetical protein